jgi:hypothetical protein
MEEKRQQGCRTPNGSTASKGRPYKTRKAVGLGRPTLQLPEYSTLTP